MPRPLPGYPDHPSVRDSHPEIFVTPLRLPFFFHCPFTCSYHLHITPSLITLNHLIHLPSLLSSPHLTSGGTFEDLIVTYSLQQLDLTTLATSDGTPLLAYFLAPVPNMTLFQSLLRSVNTTVLSQCASACLSDETCLSFSQLPSGCQLYITTAAASSPSTVAGASYYEKNQTKVQQYLDVVI